MDTNELNDGILDTDVLTKDELQDLDLKTDELARKYSVSKVHAVVFIDPEDKKRTYCFLKEPNFVTKLAVMDKATTVGIFQAAEMLREATILKEESDAITYGNSPECDDYKMGVVNFCVGMVKLKRNAFKKK